MILGDKREIVIENISQAVKRGDLNCKVEPGDPVITHEQGMELVNGYLANRHTIGFKCKSVLARWMVNKATERINGDTEIKGIHKLDKLTGGAIITSNHFSPIDNTIIRHLARRLGKKRINIISQQSNFAMTGMLGFLMNYADTIPLNNDYRYLSKQLTRVMSELMAGDEYILIYPEQEMWFNYRKPRPLMRGAYHFAVKLDVPVVSCFIEMRDKREMDTQDFYKVKYILHILEVMYPDKALKARDREFALMQRDYKLKTAAYEKAYGKKLNYSFEESDIAGWLGYDKVTG